MIILPSINAGCLQAPLVDLLDTPNPTRYTRQAIARTKAALVTLPDLAFSDPRKGALVARWPGEARDNPRASTTYVDAKGRLGDFMADLCSRIKPAGVPRPLEGTVEG